MWEALRPFRYRGTRYEPGDTVPAERWTIRRALETTRKIRFIPDVVPEPPAPVPSKMRRQELNEFALTLGITDATEYKTRELLLERVNEVFEPQSSSSSTESGEETVPVASTQDDAAGGDSEDETTEDEDADDLFADLDDDSDSNNV